VSGTPDCTFWNLIDGVGTGKTIFGRRKIGRASAVCEADLSNEFLFLIFESAAPIVISCIASFRNLLLKPHPRSAHANCRLHALSRETALVLRFTGAKNNRAKM
jgi:hypothetical protein